MTTDLSQGGPVQQTTRIFLGPSLGWADIPGTVITIAVGGVSIIDRSVGLVRVNFNGSVTIQLPSAFGNIAFLAPNAVIPVRIMDIGGFAAAHPITIRPIVGELIMGLSSVQITSNYGEMTLEPNTVSGGWNNA